MCCALWSTVVVFSSSAVALITASPLAITCERAREARVSVFVFS